MIRLLFVLLIAACSTTPALKDLEQRGPGDQPITQEGPPPPSAQTWRYAQPPTSAREETGQPSAPPAPPTDQRSYEPQPARPAPEKSADKKDYGGGPAGKGSGVGSMGGDDAYQQRSEAMRQPSPRPPAQPERPGLGTSWGEQRYSQVSEAPFQRASSSPTFQASFWYNDREGAEGMARYASGYAAMDRATLYLARGISVSLRDEYGSALPGYRANGRIYAIGENNRRYAIVIENRTNTRFEIVASVDGLDVLDGRSASYGKRGYIVDAYGRLEIEGFRQSEESVAAFRFGSIRNSYAKQTTGSDRNVGVVGIAVFAEHVQLPYWSNRDVERRQQADPFPSRWAPTPDPVYYYPQPNPNLTQAQ